MEDSRPRNHTLGTGAHSVLFHAAFRPHVQFRQIIESMKDQVGTIVFYCSPAGMYIIGNNSRNVSLVYIYLLASCCKTYRCSATTTATTTTTTTTMAADRIREESADGNTGMGSAQQEKPLSFAVKLFDMIAAMKPSKKKFNNTIVLQVRAPASTLQMEFVSDITGQPTLPPAHVPLLPSIPRFDLPSLPSLATASTFSMPSHEFKRICIELTIVGTVVTIMLADHWVRFSTHSSKSRGDIVGAARSATPIAVDDNADDEDSSNKSKSRLLLRRVTEPMDTEQDESRVATTPSGSTSSSGSGSSNSSSSVNGSGGASARASSNGVVRANPAVHVCNTVAGADDLCIHIRPEHRQAHQREHYHGDASAAVDTTMQNITHSATSAATPSVWRLQPEIMQHFVLRFLNFFSRPAQLTGRVTVGLTPGKPLIVHYQLDKTGTITYYLGQKDMASSHDSKEHGEHVGIFDSLFSGQHWSL